MRKSPSSSKIQKVYAGDRGSIPRRGDFFFSSSFFLSSMYRSCEEGFVTYQDQLTEYNEKEITDFFFLHLLGPRYTKPVLHAEVPELIKNTKSIHSDDILSGQTVSS